MMHDPFISYPTPFAEDYLVGHLPVVPFINPGSKKNHFELMIT